MRRGSPYFEFNVTVAGMTYNATRRGWDYQVTEGDTGLKYPNWVVETDLKRAGSR